MDKRKFWRNLTRIHKWAGLVLGIQIILWFASGLFMSFFDINNVRGDHIAEKQTWPLQMEQAAPLSQAYTLFESDQRDLHCKTMQKNACTISPLKHVNLLSAMGTPVWEFGTGETKSHYAGNPAKLWTGLSAAKIKSAAKSYYKGDGVMSKAVLFTEIVPKDFRKDIPIWQISFDDKSKDKAVY